MVSFLNISAYRFIQLEQEVLGNLKAKLKTIGSQLDLKGTLILSPEGINIAVAGVSKHIHAFKRELLNLLEGLEDLEYRESESNTQPFQHFFVKIKKQIIPSFKHYNPLDMKSAPYITPSELMAWFSTQKDFILLDVRNDYEIAKGSFQNKVSFGMKHFRNFPEYLDEEQLELLRQKPVVTFCTGGVRCEKASAVLLEKGVNEVYQLQGGILNYFKQYKDAYYGGGCFVFDEREVVNPIE